jgi:hypothetical protein
MDIRTFEMLFRIQNSVEVSYHFSKSELNLEHIGFATWPFVGTTVPADLSSRLMMPTLVATAPTEPLTRLPFTVMTRK